MNVIAISGNIAENIELKTTQEGTPVCSFSVAVRRPGTNDKTDFFKVVTWRKTAEFVSRYFTKGQRIEVNGILTTRKWQAKDGSKHSVCEIVASEVGFGERKQERTEGQAQPPEDEYPVFMNDEDLPF